MASYATMLQASLCSTFIASSSPLPKQHLVQQPPSSSSPSSSSLCSISASSSDNGPLVSRRSTIAAIAEAAAISPFLALPALADIEDDYKNETQKVIVQVRATLGMDKADPTRGDAVKALRQTSNDWVAKYRREKRFAGKPSYSNVYSVLNAVSGHYISYGDGSPLPTKRKTQILEEIDVAERALSRGR